MQVSVERAADPSAANCIHYLDFPAGRIDTGSVCTSASDILLEPCGIRYRNLFKKKEKEYF